MRHATLTCSFSAALGPMPTDRISFGQGGLSPDLMWAERQAEIRALKPGLMRFWIQEYFCLDREENRYDLEAIDRGIDQILAVGGTPLISLNVKPKTLYPLIDEQVIEPNDYPAWEAFVRAFVTRYVERGLTGWYWEIIGETDCGEGGGCPFLANEDNYPPFYAHTARAICEADPTARVGGPALGNVYSPILPALLDYCVAHQVPIHFLSWHRYTVDPLDLRRTAEYVNEVRARYPTLKVETILDEWSVLWETPEARDPRFLPCLIPEVIWQMAETGVDHSCYYQIRDYHVQQQHFAPFFTPHGAAFMTRWWNRMPQWGGLFDFQNTVRPAYFSFKMLKRLEGERLRADSDDPQVHGFLAFDANFQMYTLLYWNFSCEPVTLSLALEDVPRPLIGFPFLLDAETPSNDENHRIHPGEKCPIPQGHHALTVTCPPYAVQSWYFMGTGWTIA